MVAGRCAPLSASKIVQPFFPSRRSARAFAGLRLGVLAAARTIARMAHESQRMSALTHRIVTLSDILIAQVGRLPSAKLGACALATALGRVCAAHGLDIEEAVGVARDIAGQHQ